MSIDLKQEAMEIALNNIPSHRDANMWEVDRNCLQSQIVALCERVQEEMYEASARYVCPECYERIRTGTLFKKEN